LNTGGFQLQGKTMSSLVCENSENYPLLLSTLREYPKFRSVMALQAAGLAVPGILLLREWSSQTAAKVSSFVKRHKVGRVLIRSETKGGQLESPSMLGVKVGKIPSVVSRFLAYQPDTLVAIQIAGNAYRNLYNLNLLLNPWQPAHVLVEVSGPGFTARDVNRFGIVHEQIEIPAYAMHLSESILRRTYRVSDAAYQLQREAKLRRSKLKTLVQEKALLLQYPQYHPIPVDLLQIIWPELAQIRTVVEWLDLSDVGAIVSLSFLLQPNGCARHVYWDVHPMLKAF
jgi:hypothetical protein